MMRFNKLASTLHGCSPFTIILLLIILVLASKCMISAYSGIDNDDKKTNIQASGKSIVESAITIALKRKLIFENDRFELDTKYGVNNVRVTFIFLLNRPGCYFTLVLDEKLAFKEVLHGE